MQLRHIIGRYPFAPNVKPCYFVSPASRRVMLLSCLLSGLFSAVAAQFPAYDPPLKGPLLVTGTFGELRTNHYHAGLDFRAPIGAAVYSVSDGYVSRIKISPGGYGQAIYVDHPEGYRSVYGHLSALRNDLLDTVRAAQYEQERFGVDLRFDSSAYPIQQGDEIGAVGNRGYSFGPHLHFEMRSQQNDAALNPLHFGIKVKDSRPPQLRRLKVYERTAEGKLVAERSLAVQAAGRGRYILSDTLFVSSPFVEFGLKAYDRQDAMPNYNGPYGMELRRDSSLLYGFRFDSIPFEETRRLNAHVDYAEWTENESWYHRLHALPGAKHQYMETASFRNRALATGKSQEVELLVRDWSGNTSTLKFILCDGSIRSKDGVLLANESSKGWQEPATEFYRIPWNVPSLIKREGIQIELPAEALYEDLNMEYAFTDDESEGILSRVHHLHNRLTPLQSSFKLMLLPNTSIREEYMGKIVLTKCTADNESISYGGALNAEGEPIALPVRSFGTYCLQTDTIAPRITPVRFRSPLRGMSRISFKITDNFSTAGKARGLRYRATLNGRWVMLEYDLKKDVIYHDLQRPLAPDGEDFVLKVVDDRDNVAVFQRLLKP